MLSLYVAILTAVTQPVSAGAQATELRVRVRSPSGTSLDGALVALIDSADKIVAEGLSGSQGMRVLRAPEGRYRIRIRRIGFRPFFSEQFSISHDGELDVVVHDTRVALQTIVVKAGARCRRIDEDVAALGTVWEEVAKALRSSQLTVSDLSGITQARLYRKTVGIGGAVLVNDTTRLRIGDRRPFAAADPAELARIGYVRGDERRGWEYFGPDEAVLLSDEFAATHCFRLVRDKKHPRETGVSFEPVARRKIPDIAGLLWLRDSTAELHEMTFRYVNAGVISRFEGGGLTRFRRMASGAWLVSEWSLRMPRLEMQSGEGKLINAVGYDEVGGRVIEETIPTHATVETVTLNGIVRDSVSEEPLRGATVSIELAAAATDSAGRFTFTNVPVGTQTLSFSHPALSSFGFLALEREIEVKPGIPEVLLATPSLRTLWLRLCSDSAQGASIGERGILHGFVKDEFGEPVADALVTMYWTAYRPSPGEAGRVAGLTLKVRTDQTGHYATCGFRRLTQGTVIASAGNLSSTRREFTFDKSLLTRRDLSLQSPGQAQLSDNLRELTVIVTDSVKETPLPDATVFIEGTLQTVRTDDQGRASLKTNLSEVILWVRRLGYGEQALRFSLGRGRMQQVRAAMVPIQLLATVRVGGTAPLPAAIARRRNLGQGTFYGPEEIAGAQQIRTLIARTPGAVVEGIGRWAVRFRHPSGGDCWGDLYVDGRLSAPSVGSQGPQSLGALKVEELDSFSTQSIYAIEIYPRASQAPPEFVGVRDGCGVILVWTRAYAEQEFARNHSSLTAPSPVGSTKR
jgi:hypothetical protein